MADAPRRPRSPPDGSPPAADDVSITGSRVPEPGARGPASDNDNDAPLETFEQPRSSEESLLRDHPDSSPLGGTARDRALATDEA